MNAKDYRSQENGKRMSRSEDSSFPETETNTRVSYLMIGLMARESTQKYTDKSTRETYKMARDTDLAKALTMMGANMMAAGSRIRCME